MADSQILKVVFYDQLKTRHLLLWLVRTNCIKAPCDLTWKLYLVLRKGGKFVLCFQMTDKNSIRWKVKVVFNPGKIMSNKQSYGHMKLAFYPCLIYLSIFCCWHQLFRDMGRCEGLDLERCTWKNMHCTSWDMTLPHLALSIFSHSCFPDLLSSILSERGWNFII